MGKRDAARGMLTSFSNGYNCAHQNYDFLQMPCICIGLDLSGHALSALQSETKKPLKPNPTDVSEERQSVSRLRRTRSFDSRSYTLCENKSPSLGSASREACGVKESGIYCSMKRLRHGSGVHPGIQQQEKE